MNLCFVAIGAVVAVLVSGFLLWAASWCGKQDDKELEKQWLRRHAERMNP